MACDLGRGAAVTTRTSTPRKPRPPLSACMTDFLGREYNIETWLPSVERLDLFRAFTHAARYHRTSSCQPWMAARCVSPPCAESR